MPRCIHKALGKYTILYELGAQLAPKFLSHQPATTEFPSNVFNFLEHFANSEQRGNDIKKKTGYAGITSQAAKPTTCEK